MAAVTGWGRSTWGSGSWNEASPVEVTGVAGTGAVGSVTVATGVGVSVTGLAGTWRRWLGYCGRRLWGYCLCNRFRRPERYWFGHCH